VYDGLVARERRLREAEAGLAAAEAEGLRRLRAREEGIEAKLRQREARLAEQARVVGLHAAAATPAVALSTLRAGLLLEMAVLRVGPT
jgi:hypothetical protein